MVRQGVHGPVPASVPVQIGSSSLGLGAIGLQLHQQPTTPQYTIHLGLDYQTSSDNVTPEHDLDLEDHHHIRPRAGGTCVRNRTFSCPELLS